MDTINVLYCFDSKTWRTAAVSIESLLLNANPDTRIAIYCIVSPETDGYKKIKRITKSHKVKADLIWRVVQSHENPFKTPNNARWNPVVFYRFIAHRLLKNVEKIIYLGTDTLVFHDLTDLFDTDISNYVAGAVLDMAPINDSTNALGAAIRDFSARYLNNGPYYNAGVLLLNLKQMIENEHLLFETKIPMRYPDQDLFNAAFVGKIKTLPLKYNLAPGIGVPSHFTATDVAEINSGGHIIIDCYYNKPYDKQSTNKLVYDMFAKCSKNIGMKPESFLPPEPIKKTFVPHVTVQGKKILFFGMPIN